MFVVELDFENFKVSFGQTFDLMHSIEQNIRVIKQSGDYMMTKQVIINGMVGFVNWTDLLYKGAIDRKKIKFSMYKVKYKNMLFVQPGIVNGMLTKLRVEQKDGENMMMLHDLFTNPDHHIHTFLNTHLYESDVGEWKQEIDLTKEG